jgi:hypothetical protein
MQNFGESLPGRSLLMSFLNDSKALLCFRKKLASFNAKHGRMARGDHGLPKVSLIPAMAYPSIAYGQTTSETA